MMQMNRRVVRAGAASLAAAGAGLFMFRMRSEQRVSGPVSAHVSISRDPLGVPTITARSRNDALVGLGYATAEDRIFQMDLLRRAAHGRLSEIIGPDTLRSDRLYRLLGITRTAGQLVEQSSAEVRQALEAYSEGINLYLEHHFQRIEFLVLRYRPEPWRPIDSMAIGRFMAFRMSSFHADDLLVARVREAIGDEWTDAIVEGRTVESSPVVHEQAMRRFSTDPADFELFGPPPTGSNAWVISGKRSATGVPLLANDPHLGYTNPSIWSEAKIEAPGFEVAGFTIPGLPAMMIGRAKTFAWGLTTSMISQSYLYNERISDDGLLVDHDGGRVPLTVRREEINVRGRAHEELTVRSTPRGPLLSDIRSDWKDRPVSIYWTGTEVGAELEAWLRLNTAVSVKDAISIRQLVSVPSMNILAADSAGNIATITVGKVADRAAPAGLLDPMDHPPRYIPSDDLPIEINPKRGWIVQANNPVVGSDYPYNLHGFYEPGFRLRRIMDVLESRPIHTLTDTRALQTDMYSIHAAELTPILLDLLGQSAPEWARVDLASWNFHTVANSRATLVFEGFYRHWVEASLGHRLPRPIVKRLVGKVVGDIPIGFCDRLLRGEFPSWISDDDRREIVRASFQAALQWIEQQLGADHDQWTWGKLHTLTFVHPFGKLSGPHQGLVNAGPFQIGGDRTTVWPSGYDPEHPFRVVGGPSMRLIADLSRPDTTWATNTLGQSGRLFSRNARNQLGDFLTGQLHPIWTRPGRHSVTIQPQHERQELHSPRRGTPAILLRPRSWR